MAKKSVNRNIFAGKKFKNTVCKEFATHTPIYEICHSYIPSFQLTLPINEEPQCCPSIVVINLQKKNLSFEYSNWAVS